MADITLNTELLDYADADLRIRYRDPDDNQVKEISPADLASDSTLETFLAKKALGVTTETPVGVAIRTAYKPGSGAGLVDNTAGNDYNPGGGVGVGEVDYTRVTQYSLLFVQGTA